MRVPSWYYQQFHSNVMNLKGIELFRCFLHQKAQGQFCKIESVDPIGNPLPIRFFLEPFILIRFISESIHIQWFWESTDPNEFFEIIHT